MPLKLHSPRNLQPFPSSVLSFLNRHTFLQPRGAQQTTALVESNRIEGDDFSSFFFFLFFFLFFSLRLSVSLHPTRKRFPLSGRTNAKTPNVVKQARSRFRYTRQMMSFFLFNHLPWLYNYRGRPRYLRSTRIYPEPGLSSSSISLASNPAFRIWPVFAGVHRSSSSLFPLPSLVLVSRGSKVN